SVNVNLLTGLRVVNSQDAVVVANVKMVTIDDWGRCVRASFGLPPDDAWAGRLILRQRDIAGRVRSDDVELAALRIPTAEIKKIVGDNRRRNLNLTIIQQAPQL